MRISFSFVATIITATLMLAACGYYNPYLAGKSGDPVLVHRTMWINRTTEAGLENIIYQALSDWLRKGKLITLSASSAGADYQLSGEIVRVDYPETAFGTYQMATVSRAELTVKYTLFDNRSGKEVWKRSVTRVMSFALNPNPMILQANKRAAFVKIADKIGEEVYLYLTNIILRPGEIPAVEELDEGVIQD